jgi:hypothetical protein
VAVLAVVGNEDGRTVSAQLYQALNDTGWTLPAGASAIGWGSTRQDRFKDLDRCPEKIAKTATMVASNAAHLARFSRAATIRHGRIERS